ncbi:MAG: beta-L-arabinofuranosidase domain-containing protein, partial [Candidatus Cryptobacteroides sp.]
DLVYNFRQKAGLPMPPRSERHSYFWTHQLPGSTAGRFLMGAGGTLRWMDNGPLRERMDSVIDVIDQCKEPDGYLMAYPKRAIFDFENGAYVRSWITHGLIEAGYAGNPKAFGLLRGFYDWFEASPFLPEMLRRPGQGVQGAIPLTRTYFSPVGKPDEICVMQRYFQQNYWMEWLKERNTDAIWKYPYDRPHNYLVTAVEPYLDLYRATGDENYLEAVLGFWDLFHDNWEHIGGSLAINEGYFPYPPKSLFLKANTGELCGNAFWVKLNQRFHNLYPYEEKYVSEIEKSLYNVIIPNQVGDRGIAYFARMHGRKQGYLPNAEIATNTCCEGQGTRIYGSLPEYIYSLKPDGAQINLFEASTLTHEVNGQRFGLNMQTQFPYSNEVSVTLSCDAPLDACIEIRVPEWAARPLSVELNGKKLASGKPGTYIRLERTWKNGDRLDFVLPAQFRTTRYAGMEKGFETGHYALEYGPVLMSAVCTGDNTEPSIPCTAAQLIPRLVPVSGKPLHFTVEGCSDIEIMPYYEVEDQAFSNFPGFLE